MELLHAMEEEELALLAQAWGPVTRQDVSLDVADPFLSGRGQRLTSAGRRAEICYVMHRGEPADGVLLHRNQVYPPGVMRLPTGGVQEGENVLGTLAREVYEETGMALGDGEGQVRAERFLGVLRYDFNHRTLGRHEYASYFFLVRMPEGGVLTPTDPHELIEAWGWWRPDELPAVAEQLESIGAAWPQWADWGRYRALAHRFVAAQLA